MKKCAKCGIYKHSSEFHKSRKENDGLKSRCKSCIRDDNKEYREKYPEIRKETCRKYHKNNASALNQKSRSWYANNKEKAKKTRREWREANSERMKEKVSEYQLRNKDHLSAMAKIWQSKNKDKLLEKAKRYRERNKEKVLANGRAWRQKNRHKVNAKKSARIANQKKAKPKWADQNKIVEIYKYAKQMTENSGEQWHVDHIVPVNSKVVCGLHCEDNLRAILGKKNQSKSNRFWPDMP